MTADIVVEDWQFKVSRERDELEQRMYKLNTFMKSKAFDRLCLDEVQRLHNQRRAMQDYSQALTERIAHFYTTGD